LAAFAVLSMVDKLYEADKFEGKDLEVVLLSVLIPKKPEHLTEKIITKISDFWNKLCTKIGIEGIKTKSGTIWHPNDVFTKPGIRTENNEYFEGNGLDSKQYGWRLGTMEEAVILGLKKVPNPANQTQTLQNQKVIESIYAVKHNMKKFEQTTQNLGEKMEKMEKTGQIVEGAKYNVLQRSLEKEKAKTTKLENDIKEERLKEKEERLKLENEIKQMKEKEKRLEREREKEKEQRLKLEEKMKQMEDMMAKLMNQNTNK